MTRRLWIDTKGQPVITTTPNGVRNATRWGWTPAVAVAPEQAEAIDRMGPAAGCHLCVGAGGYPDHDDQWVECSCQWANREPSAAEVRAAAESILYENQPNSTRHAVDWPVSTADAVEIARAALLAARIREQGS